MKAQDISYQSDSELSMLVFGDKFLYKKRRSLVKLLRAVNEMYIYTDSQLDTLIEDLKESENEE